MAQSLNEKLSERTRKALNKIQFKKAFVETIESYYSDINALANHGANHYYLDIDDFQKKLLGNLPKNAELTSLSNKSYHPSNLNYSISEKYPFDKVLLSKLVNSYIKSEWHLYAELDDINLIISWSTDFSTLNLSSNFIKQIKGEMRRKKTFDQNNDMEIKKADLNKE